MTRQAARRLTALCCVAALATIATGCGRDEVDSRTSPTASSASPQVSFTSPADGATVKSPVTVTMTASNFTIEPAGDVHAGAGHFHVMVDVGCVAPGTVIPKDDAHVHLGKAQLSTDIVLAPGPHKLCLQVGDGAHTALDITDEIAITVSG